MSILLSHPTGNANVRNAVLGLHESGLLGAFYTTVATFDGNLWDRLSQSKLGREFERRRYAKELSDRTHQLPTRELGRLLSQKLGLKSLHGNERSPFSIDSVYQSLDRYCAKQLNSNHWQAIYAYEDGALHSFQHAKEQGSTCIYELPIGYWRAAKDILTEEAEALPDWAMTMPSLNDSPNKLERKDQELALADSIIVASRFTAQTLEQVPFNIPQPLVIPYGCPNPSSKPSLEPTTKRAPLKVLYAGGMTQRKGLSYLLDAVEQLGSQVELTLIGQRVSDCAPLDRALERYTWHPSMPHQQMLKTMRSMDVLVFPSLFEGFGLVVTEALSQGIPVIATPNTCAPDILTEGKDGFIVPIRDASSIAEKLQLLHQDRDRLAQMKSATHDTAASKDWKAYRHNLACEIGALLSK